MIGHAFWNEFYSRKFVQILEDIYEDNTTKGKLWETVYKEHITQLKMKIRCYASNDIYEFDSLDELRLFDHKYLNDSGSLIMQELSRKLNCSESEMTNMKPLLSDKGKIIGVLFQCKKNNYCYNYETKELDILK